MEHVQVDYERETMVTLGGHRHFVYAAALETGPF
jgi:hypothetical protein